MLSINLHDPDTVEATRPVGRGEPAFVDVRCSGTADQPWRHGEVAIASRDPAMLRMIARDFARAAYLLEASNDSGTACSDPSPARNGAGVGEGEAEPVRGPVARVDYPCSPCEVGDCTDCITQFGRACGCDYKGCPSNECTTCHGEGGDGSGKHPFGDCWECGLSESEGVDHA